MVMRSSGSHLSTESYSLQQLLSLCSEAAEFWQFAVPVLSLGPFIPLYFAVSSALFELLLLFRASVFLLALIHVMTAAQRLRERPVLLGNILILLF